MKWWLATLALLYLCLAAAPRARGDAPPYNEEQYRLLTEEGVEAWNRWREENENVAINLREADLQGMDLGGADLQGADLTEADLQKTGLWRTDLQAAELSLANLQKAHLWAADLREASLEGANLREARLGAADLRKADLIGADLRDTYLLYTNLQGANLWFADLRGAYLNGANLQGVGLWGANLQEADLWGANLQGADLSFADLQGADLRGADLREADLGGADLTGVDFRDAGPLEYVTFYRATLQGTQLYREQVGDVIFEERSREWFYAKETYLALKNNWEQTGHYDDAAWAYRRERRMEKMEAWQMAREAVDERNWKDVIGHLTKATTHQLQELVCDLPTYHFHG